MWFYLIELSLKLKFYWRIKHVLYNKRHAISLCLRTHMQRIENFSFPELEIFLYQQLFMIKQSYQNINVQVCGFTSQNLEKENIIIQIHLLNFAAIVNNWIIFNFYPTSLQNIQYLETIFKVVNCIKLLFEFLKTYQSNVELNKCINFQTFIDTTHCLSLQSNLLNQINFNSTKSVCINYHVWVD